VREVAVEEKNRQRERGRERGGGESRRDSGLMQIDFRCGRSLHSWNSSFSRRAVALYLGWRSTYPPPPPPSENVGRRASGISSVAGRNVAERRGDNVSLGEGIGRRGGEGKAARLALFSRRRYRQVPR